MIQNYFFDEDAVLEDLGEGVSRKVLAYNRNMMIVRVDFETGAIGKLHDHPHEQITYVLEGEFEFNIEGNKKVLKKGDSTYKEPSVVHGAVCLKKGSLLDIFTPMREDFV